MLKPCRLSLQHKQTTHSKQKETPHETNSGSSSSHAMETRIMFACDKLMMIALSLLCITPASSFSFGAGGCFASRPSIASLHLRQMKLVTGTLAEGNLSVLLDGKPLYTTRTNSFTTNELHNLTLTTTADEGYFRGFLFRLGDPHAIPDPDALAVPGDAGTHLNTSSVASMDSTASFILPTDMAESQLAAACLLHNASGIGHTSSSKKTTVSGILNMNHATSEIRLDVTVVVRNRNHVSEFYYSGYDMHAVDKGRQLVTILLVGVALIGVTVVGVFAVKCIIKRRRRQEKKVYYELASVKMAEDADGESEHRLDHDNDDDRLVAA